MHSHKFTLEPYKGMKTRYTCPNCGQKKAFTRYIYVESGEHLADHVGKCNREVNCGYHYTPKQYFQDSPRDWHPSMIPQKPVAIHAVSYIDKEILSASLKAHESNHLITFLINALGESKTRQLIEEYYLGSARHWQGATVFWQIDTKNKVRSGKIMLYNPITGKRVKEPFNHITWVHSALNLPDFHLRQCFFGEHLLNQSAKPVAIVESEKTALIAKAFEPGFIWLATGSLSNLTAEKCRVLQGRKVCLFPDVNALEKWKIKAHELSSIARFRVSDLLEEIATEEDSKQGLDLADYLLRGIKKQ